MELKGYERVYYSAHQKAGDKEWKWMDGYVQKRKNKDIFQQDLEDTIKMFKSFPCFIRPAPNNVAFVV
jgi:hypothetical protein